MMTTTTLPSSNRKLQLPGAHRVTHRERPGKPARIYWYAWRGGPLLASIKGDTLEACEASERRQAGTIAEKYGALSRPRPSPDFIAGLVADFRASPEWRAYAPSTRREWGRHLDAINLVFGTTKLEAIQKRGARALIRKWHQSMDEKPRKANIALTVLNRLFNWGVDQEQLLRNPAAGLSRLDEGRGRAGVVWSPAELSALLLASPPAAQRAFAFLFLTGLRREDAVQLRWDQVRPDLGHIIRPTNKSRNRRRGQLKAHIPITGTLAAFLDDQPRTAVTVLTNEAGRPYASGASLRPIFDRSCLKAGVAGKHIHDLRGTRATIEFSRDVSDAAAERFFGWAPGQGAKMREVYADPTLISVLQFQGRTLSDNEFLGASFTA